MLNTKDPDVKIIQITAAPLLEGVVYGLGDDGYIYVWSPVLGEWFLHTKKRS